MSQVARKSANWDIIHQMLINNGAEDIQGLRILYKFPSHQSRANAQTALSAAIPWAFFAGPNCAAALGVPAGIPTINSATITFYSSALPQGRITSSNDNFFMFGK
jgi:hypothetical protein